MEKHETRPDEAIGENLADILDVMRAMRCELSSVERYLYEIEARIQRTVLICAAGTAAVVLAALIAAAAL